MLIISKLGKIHKFTDSKGQVSCKQDKLKEIHIVKFLKNKNIQKYNEEKQCFSYRRKTIHMTEHFSSETKWGTQEVARCFSMKSTADNLCFFMGFFPPFFLNFGMPGIWGLNVRHSHKNDTGCEYYLLEKSFSFWLSVRANPEVRLIWSSFSIFLNPVLLLKTWSISFY